MEANDKSVIEGQPVGVDVPEDSKPISKWDWFKLSRSWVTGAEERILKQAENIQSAVNWFFGLGSSATILSILFKDPHLGKVSIVLFALVLFFLFVAYALAILATTTISKSVDKPNDADCIREVFNKSNERAGAYLVVSSVCLFLGMALIAPALWASFKKETPVRSDDRVRFVASYFSEPVVSEGTVDKKEREIKGVDLSGRTIDSSFLNVWVDTGQALQTAKPVYWFKHGLSGSTFDLRERFPVGFNLGKGKMFVTIIYKNGKDSLLVKSVLAVGQK